MGASEETIALLTRVAESNERILALLERSAPKETASAVDLDGKYGDPDIKRDPKRWTGAPVAPCRMSECPSEYLDVLASFYDWQADQDDKTGAKTSSGKPKSTYGRLDAARARGWAARKRAGWQSPQGQRQQPAQPISQREQPQGAHDEPNEYQDFDGGAGGGW